jgi:GT2 family glycosyltransferase
MKIIAISVLYKCEIKNSKTINSLIRNYNQNSKSFENFKLVIFDNGPFDQNDNLSLPFEFSYVINEDNPGLAVAYNYALDYGIINYFDWILLLDQDSVLPVNFIQELTDNLNLISEVSKIKAVVPKMYYQNHFFSPSKVLYGGIHRPININARGIYPAEIFAIASGCLIKISFLKKIGGFNKLFWLDCLDRWLFLMIYKDGGGVFISDSKIEHDLSVLNYKDFINEERYENIMMHETLFIKIYKSYGENFIYSLRLISRAILFYFDRNKRKYSIATFQHLKKIFTIKKSNKL